MKTLHLIGHYHKWNLDSYYQNSIGDGFVFCAYSFPFGFFEADKINTYNTNEILGNSFFDLQYFGKREAGKISKGKLKTYPFHPANHADSSEQTNILLEGLIKRGIDYQIKVLGLTDVIIPNMYENERPDNFISMVKSINKWLATNKRSGIRYFMTIPIPNHTVIDEKKIDTLLYHLTDQEIVFDGYYIACEAKPEGIQKINIDYKYLNNLATVLSVLKKQKFITIYSYANWDALVFLALTDIDYISIGTYENLRNFNIKRFTVDEDGGPSKGWYFSEKLLNMIKSPLIDLIRLNKGIDLIRNERNIFSDAILEPGFPWSNQKPEVHKNYLLAIDRLLKELSIERDLTKRKALTLEKIDKAIAAYSAIEAKGIYMTNESKNYHLDVWKSFLLSRKPLF
jgi:hypothetical protein